MIAAKNVQPPMRSFRSPGGRTSTVGAGTKEIVPSEWSVTFPVSYKGKPAGFLYDSNSYCRDVPPTHRDREPKGKKLRWSGSTNKLRWSVPGFTSSGFRGGYDVAAYDTPKECAEAWGRSADEILDWGKAHAEKTAGGGGAKGAARKTASGTARSSSPKLREFEVKLREEGTSRWWHHGFVKLRDFAPDHEVEQALSAIKIYMPRGMDTLEWSTDRSPSAVIRQYGDTPMVKIVPRSTAKVTCKLCQQKVQRDTAHRHQGGWVGDDCCWDERLRSTE